MSRAKEFEDAVENFLDLHNCKKMRVDNYRCFKCGQVQNVKAKGWPDFFVYYPFVLAIECKTGKAKMTKEQRETAKYLHNGGIKYMLLRDNLDDLIEFYKTEEKKWINGFKFCNGK